MFGPGAVEWRLLNTMATLANVYRLVKKVRGMTGDTIHRLSEEERDMLEWLVGEGWL